MSTFDQGSLIRATVQDKVIGMNMHGMGALTDSVCNVVNRESLSGTENRRDTKDSSPRDKGGRAVGSDRRYRTHGLAADNFDMQQYDDGFSIEDAELKDADQYGDELGDDIATARSSVNVAIDADLQALLGAETQTQAASGVWSTTTTNIVLDIQTGIQANVPGALTNPNEYIGVLGITSALEAARNDSLRDKVANFSGGGSMGITDSFGALRGALQEISGVPMNNWFVAGSWFDQNDQGLALNIGFLFGDFFWFGKKSNLKWLEQPRMEARGDLPQGSMFGDISVHRVHSRNDVSYRRLGVHLRQDDAVAFRMTGL
jgi:hypothetical protein